MAFAQVLPNPAASSSARKQGHLEAGKRRLEEFRKKRAAGKAEKSLAAAQLRTDAVGLAESLSPEAISNGPNHEGNSFGISEPSRMSVPFGGTAATGSAQNVEVGSSHQLHSVSNGRSEHSEDTTQQDVKDQESTFCGSSQISAPVSGYEDHWQDKSSETRNTDTDLVSTEIPMALDSAQMGSVADDDLKANNAYPTAVVKLDNYDTPIDNSNSYASSSFRNSAENLENGVQQYTISNDSMPLINHNASVNSGSINYSGFNLKGRSISDSINHHLNIKSMDQHASENFITDYSSMSKSSYGSGSGRHRPSFLDSINVSQVSSMSSLPSAKLGTDLPVLCNTNSMNGELHREPSPPLPPAKPNAVELTSIRHNDNTEDREELSPVKDDNFASLEQHIEDLTQDKFSLQRALDMSRTLSESLASENSSLTESFNQQGKAINQLRSEMEQLREEIKTQLMAFEALKAEYANAQLECTAADERAKILASEVISLEEKALRLRSNELKLEKQLESSNAEINSCKRKLSSLEKERHDFQSTIEMLQEEKKLLQSKLWKATVHDIANNRNDTLAKIDASTSTMDLDVHGETDLMASESLRNPLDELGSSSSTILAEDASNITLQYDNRDFQSDASGTIPDDHMKMINNINSVISELALEKEELVEALAAESSMTSKLKELNKELSQKLESQTRRFELLAAQKMANGNAQSRPVGGTHEIIHDAADYTDEGDEVVERVLGWIMKLFPGGPAKRRTSKLL